MSAWVDGTGNSELRYVYNTYESWWATHKKLTITLDQVVYEGLHHTVGRRRISQFIEDLVRPHVVDVDLDGAYRQMAKDEAREAEALALAEATVGDVDDAKR